MADYRKTPSLMAPGASADVSFELPAHGSLEGDPAARDPGRSPSSRRAPHGIRLPGGEERFAPDDNIARPEHYEEVIDGVRIQCFPALPEHADPQCRLAHVVSACLAEGFLSSTELLTRTDRTSDFATDVCVRRQGVDPETGGRYLEELAFEVANTQTLKDLEEVRVPKLMRAGVRRFFAVLVQEGDVLEWSVDDGEWRAWAREELIRDPVFAQPLEVAAILDAAQVGQLVSKAQLAKREPFLMGVIKKREEKARAKGEARGEMRGRTEGLRRTVEDLCQLLGIRWSDDRKTRVDAMSLPELKALRERLLAEKRWPGGE